MATKKKLLQAAAGTAAAGGAGLNVEEVFSTYVYEGNSSTQTITNGIDLDGEGGLVWTKNREDTRNHILFDTERANGEDYSLFTNNTDAALENSSFNFAPASTGYTFNNSDIDVNLSGNSYVSWSWRKASRFFDCVTYTGNGSTQTITHNLGSVPAVIITKETSGTSNWAVYHRSLGKDKVITLNSTNAASTNTNYWNDTAPTSTEFTLGSTLTANQSGETYVAYLFAHNDGDGNFGPNGDADIIKCGSYTGNGSSTGPEIDLGFEPQWILVKKATALAGTAQDWWLFDNMRGWLSNSSAVYGNLGLRPNLSNAENDRNDSPYITPTGFELNDASDRTNGNGETYIYIAIRRGPMAVPTDATEVFDVGTYTSTGVAGNDQHTGFPIDMALIRGRTATNSWYWGVSTRLLGGAKYLSTSSTAALTDNGIAGGIRYDDMEGFSFDGAPFNNDGSMVYLAWKRARGHFDVVAYTGNGTAGRTVSHNLGVAPEMMWVKNRDSAVNWLVYHKDVGAGYYGVLSGNNVFDPSNNAWNSTAPTDTEFTLGIFSNVNSSGDDYIAYLFASLDGVSKVGSFSHTNGTSQNIDCGFSSGARFVMLKRYDSTGSWVVFDTERGIVSGNDPYLALNTTDAEVTSNDVIDPYSSGFTVASGFLATGDWIFYAVA